MPVAYDIEDPSQDWMSKEMLTDIAIAFCDEIKAAGYQPMIYCNPTFIQNRLDMVRLREKRLRCLDCKLWCFELPIPLSGKIWQYTSKGSVSGIMGNVDMNHWYVGKEYYGGAPLPNGQRVAVPAIM